MIMNEGNGELTAADPLSSSEFELISRIHRICMWLASENRTETISRCMDEFELTEASAELWISKAEAYMALGAFDNVDESRRMYHLRLTEIYNLCMKHVVRDMIEITTRPVRVEVVEDESGEKKKVMITGQITKVKPNSFDVGAIQGALKAAREAAHITGGRPRNLASFRPGQVNILQINEGELPAAQQTLELSNAQLASLAGYDIVDVLPEPSGAQSPDQPGNAPSSEEVSGS